LLCCQASTDRLAGLWSLHRAIVSCYNLEVREGIFCYGKALLYHSYATVGYANMPQQCLFIGIIWENAKKGTDAPRGVHNGPNV